MRPRRIFSLLTVLVSMLALTVLPGAAGATVPLYPEPAAKRLYIAPHTNPGDWPTYGHDVSRTSFNPDETLLNAGNVSQMVQRWQANVNNSNSPTSGTPSVSGGKVFVGSSIASGNNNFFAYDAVSGSRLWAANLNNTGCFGLGIGSSSAVSGTVVSVGGGDSAYYGLNPETGDILWREPMNVGTSGFPWSSPILAYDRSYLGMASCADNP